MPENVSTSHLNRKLVGLHKKLMAMATLLRIKLPLSLTLALHSPSGLCHNLSITTILARIVQEELRTLTMHVSVRGKITLQSLSTVAKPESNASVTALKSA